MVAGFSPSVFIGCAVEVGVQRSTQIHPAACRPCERTAWFATVIGRRVEARRATASQSPAL